MRDVAQGMTMWREYLDDGMCLKFDYLTTRYKDYVDLVPLVLLYYVQYDNGTQYEYSTRTGTVLRYKGMQISRF